MAAKQVIRFTDEEVLEELNKLGFNDVSPEIFQMVKEDLARLAEEEEFMHQVLNPSPNPSSRSTESSRKQVRNDSHIPVREMSELSLSNTSEEVDNINKNRPTRLEINKNIQRKTEECSSTEDDSLNRNSSDSFKTIKRKVMRHRNGEKIITEELLVVPNVLKSTTDITESSSSEELTTKSGSMFNLNVGFGTTSRSSSSMSSTSSASRLSKMRRKKSDPVAMYNYYRKFWDNFKPPGEKSHDKLRWAVRDRMMDYNLT